MVDQVTAMVTFLDPAEVAAWPGGNADGTPGPDRGEVHEAAGEDEGDRLMTKAFLIDAAAREIREIASAGLSDLQRLIGGYIETAYVWGSGDVLFVDEEGMQKPQRYFFRLRRLGDQPLAGNGVVVGPERYDDTANTSALTMSRWISPACARP